MRCRRPSEDLQLASVRGVEPGDLHRLVQNAFNSKDVDALVALYEPNAWLFGPDGPVQGHDAIRDTWAGFVALGAQLEMVTQYVVLQDEIALLSNRWTARIGDDEMSAVTAEVARRQPDGTWRYLIDNPDGAATGVLAAEA